jgi:predicted nucleic acid-binding protein
LSRKPRKAPRGIVDTSVVIAGAAAFRGAPLHPETASGRLILNWIEKDSFQWIYSEDILDEYKDLLKRFSVRPSVVGKFINLLREEGIQIRVRKNTAVSPDPADDPFCACAETGNAAFIVTLNPRDFPQSKIRAKVISPGDDLPLTTKRKLS